KRGRYFDSCQINERGLMSAEEAYQDLKKYFISNGKYVDASWASFKEKTMEKMLLKKKRNLAYLPSLLMDILCGYGEKPYRVILSSAAIISVYAFLFLALNSVTYAQSSSYKLAIGDYIYYSIVTFTTVGYGDFVPRPSSLFRLLAASEAFVGAFMIGLFIFTLARRYSAR
ncbi:MAG: two pore domain potassium channel family protein, partial [Candidatus Omnitrophica bacterium]|nr:two pore domain potassium channel family protein [Candidatus Omnitrophota bacterium]